MRASDDLALLLMHALRIQPATDPSAAAVRYGGVEVRRAEEDRDRQRQSRLAELRRRFVDGPVLLMPGGGHGFSDSHGAVVIPGEGTVYFGDYRQSGEWGVLEATRGVLLSTDGGTRRLPAPVPGDSTAISGDGWTFKAAAGWVVRAGARQGDYVVVRQQDLKE
jgi:hypothetical protein